MESDPVTAVGGSGEFITGDSVRINVPELLEEESFTIPYRLTELSAPEGHLPSDEPQYFVWMEQGAMRNRQLKKCGEMGR